MMFALTRFYCISSNSSSLQASLCKMLKVLITNELSINGINVKSEKEQSQEQRYDKFTQFTDYITNGKSMQRTVKGQGQM